MSIINIFNNEIIKNKMFEYLNTDSISNLRLTNKFFKYKCNDRLCLEIFFPSIDLLYMVYDYSLFHLKTLVRDCKRVKTLTIHLKKELWDNASFSSKLLFEIFEVLDCRFLISLDLQSRHINILCDQSLELCHNNEFKNSFNNKIANIKSLSLGNNISYKLFNFKNLKYIEELKISMNNETLDYELFWDTITDNFENIKSLYVSESIMSFVCPKILKLKKLKKLLMCECGFCIFPEIISEIQSLECVIITNDHLGDYKGLICMRRLKNLKTFIIDRYVVDFKKFKSDQELLEHYHKNMFKNFLTESFYKNKIGVS